MPTKLFFGEGINQVGHHQFPVKLLERVRVRERRKGRKRGGVGKEREIAEREMDYFKANSQ